MQNFKFSSIFLFYFPIMGQDRQLFVPWDMHEFSLTPGGRADGTSEKSRRPGLSQF
jgi:hypothetical protein